MKIRELRRLRESYVEIRGRLINTIKNSDYEVDVAGDAVDKLQGASLLTVQNQLSRKNVLKLRALEKAIEKIDDGQYGDCEKCGEEIGIKRLEAIPGCSVCISCAEKAELQR
jgi:DnaK suppressor protein